MKNSKELRETTSYFATEGITSGRSRWGLKFSNYRSLHDERFAKYLKALNIPFEYDKQGIPINDEQQTHLHYIPDFYIPSKKLYIEVVNKMNKRLRYKIFWFKEQHPNKEIMLITAKEVRDLFLGRTTLF
jgi:hypothetical protein